MTSIETSLYNEVRYWVPVLGAMFGLYKAYFKTEAWFKDFREKDVKNIQDSVMTLHTELAKQTTEICGAMAQTTTAVVANTKEVAELRTDIKTSWQLNATRPARAAARRKR